MSIEAGAPERDLRARRGARSATALRAPALAAACALAVAIGGCMAGSEDRSSGGDRVRGEVERVVDGDTLQVRVGSGDVERVRLLGIDTPETVAPDRPVGCGGRQATAHLKRLATGREVTLSFDDSQDRRDRYGRLLAYVSLAGEGNRDLNLEQVAAGWARVYVYAGHPFERVDEYREAQQRARESGRGVWGACGAKAFAPSG